MIRIPIALASTALILLMASPSTALHCNGEITTINTGLETYYLDDRSTGPGEINHWLYREDNGVDGLQSGSYYPMFPCPEPNCGEQIPFWFYDPCDHLEPDVYIF